MSDVLLVGNVLDGDVVVVLLHQLLRGGQALGGGAGDCFGCHVQCSRPFRVDQRCSVDGGCEELELGSHFYGRGGRDSTVWHECQQMAAR